MNKKILLALIMAALSVGSANANAGVVTFVFTSPVVHISGPDIGVKIGDSFRLFVEADNGFNTLTSQGWNSWQILGATAKVGDDYTAIFRLPLAVQNFFSTNTSGAVTYAFAADWTDISGNTDSLGFGSPTLYQNAIGVVTSSSEEALIVPEAFISYGANIWGAWTATVNNPPPTQNLPLPSTLSLVGLGLALLGVRKRL